MKLNQLSLANYCGFEQLDIDFEPDITVIAGVNGVGKSSVLNALAVLLSRALPEFTPCRATPLNFTDDQVHLDASSLAVSLKLVVGGQILDAGIQRVSDSESEGDRFLLLRQDWVADNDELLNFHNLLALRTMTGNLEAGVKETRAALRDLKGQTNLPIAIYFSPKRQLPGQPRTLSAPKAFDPVQAYSRALSDREVELREFMHWFRTQETLGAGEGSPQAAVLDSLRNVVSQLVPEFTNLRIVEEPRLGFVVEKDGKSLYLHQLSDGERGLLALVFDLTRRLAIANPESEDPISEGVALVLLDEVELHLHPKWQRHVVRRLCQVFKNCQFVITTHSPQVIGQVKAEKLRVLNINDSGKVVLFQPTQAFGMDSSWVLQNIMGVPARDYETEQKLSKVFDAIDEGKYGDARELANEMRAEIGDFPDLQEAIALLDRFELLGQG